MMQFASTGFFSQKHNHSITEMPTSGDLKSGDSLSFTTLGISTTHVQDIKQILVTGSLCVKGRWGGDGWLMLGVFQKRQSPDVRSPEIGISDTHG